MNKTAIITGHTHLREPKEQLKEAMKIYGLSEFDMARQLGISLLMVRNYLTGGSVPIHIDKLVVEWLE